MNRKSAPKVKRGRVQKKNNWTPTADYYNSDQALPLIDRQRPGKGYRHLLKRRDIEEFIAILPEWEELSKGLNAIVLALGSDAMGWHERGVVHVCAWEEGLWWNDTAPAFVDNHREIYELLDVVVEKQGERLVTKWTEAQARAFQLLHVLLHEFGHHHDRMTTSSQRSAARGERFAEDYARRHEARIWEDYLRRFGLWRLSACDPARRRQDAGKGTADERLNPAKIMKSSRRAVGWRGRQGKAQGTCPSWGRWINRSE